ncbi:hypothetical protein MHU86_7262 [Fragilaria crotonensis]|nr:hypothetical protein MHU86_7262 [Fragilaria crotonensis]
MSSLDGTESQSSVVDDNESQQLREDYETVTESDDETEHDATAAVPAMVDDNGLEEDDDLALLAFAKQRLAEQQTKDEEATRRQQQQQHVDDDEEEYEDEEAVEGDFDDDEDRGEDDKSASESGSEKEDPEAPVSGESKSAGVDESVSFVSEEKKDDHVTFAADEPARRQRDENAELWDLLRQSKSRIQSTRNIIVEDSDVDESERSTGAAAEEDESADDGVAPLTQVFKSDQDLREEERKRKFQKENRELWELLQKSKNRLEEAAKAKMKEAAKAAAANDVTPQPVARIENPYKEIDAVPDEAESEDALTQKELLLAMAVAEEAARSGKECFETPSKAELRTRDIRSFDFIQKEFGLVPETPIGNDAKEEERERNRFAKLSEALSSQWASFRVAVGDLDISQRLPRSGSHKS